MDEVEIAREDDTLPDGTLEVGETFEAFYAREFRAVTGLAFALSGSRLGAEDLAQEAFLAAYRHWDRIARYERPGAWVRRVVANRSVSAYRRRLSEARAVTRLALGRRTSVEELPGEAADFWDAVRSLPARQAQAATLHYLEDLPLADIARILDCAEGTVKAHLHRARRALARLLGEGESPDEEGEP